MKQALARRSRVRPDCLCDWVDGHKKRAHDGRAFGDADGWRCYSACGDRLKFVALILDEDPARAILESLHLPSEPPPLARARSPNWLDPIPVDAVSVRAGFGRAALAR